MMLMVGVAISNFFSYLRTTTVNDRIYGDENDRSILQQFMGIKPGQPDYNALS